MKGIHKSEMCTINTTLDEYTSQSGKQCENE